MSDGPLAGLRVVDCSGLIAGGFATTTLADFGADVVTVEHPEKPDPLRDWPPIEDGSSLWWKAIGRNKRCVTLNLGTEEGRELTLELVEDADVVFENFRPGTMERWGLGYEDLRAVNEDVIMVRISGYGQSGPKSEKPGFGTAALGYSGFAYVNGFSDREPLLPPLSLADFVASMFAVQGTMFAVYERDWSDADSSGGQVVDVSLFEPLFRLFVGFVEWYSKQGHVPQRNGNRHLFAAPRSVYRCADGRYVTLSASAPSIFERLATLMDRPDLVDDDRFATNNDRLENVDELNEMIQAWVGEYPRDELIEKMEAANTVVAPVYNIADIFEDEHYAERGVIADVDDPDVGSLKTHAPVPRLSRTPGVVSHAGPEHGEHNEEIFVEELGLDPELLEELRASNVI